MKSLYFLILFFWLSCKTSPKVQPELVWGYSGWGVSPDKIQNPISLSKEEKLDYFYMVVKGKAASRAVEVNSPSFMESTCKLSALKENQEQLISQTIFSTNPKLAQDAAFLEKIKQEFFKNSKPSLAYCRGTGTEETYATCDCVIYLFFEGGKEALKKAISTLK